MGILTAEIISIGDELLNGQTINTNASWMAYELDSIGVKTNNIITISDSKEAIKNALIVAQQRANIILITGGLGPTKDDITKKTLSDFFNSDLIRNEEHYNKLNDFFKSLSLIHI